MLCKNEKLLVTS